jgi:hypothetical protein
MNTYQTNTKRGTVRCHGLLSMAALVVLGLLCTSSSAACWCAGVDEPNCIMVVPCIDVPAGEVFRITDNCMVTLTGTGGENVSTIDGQLELEGNATLRITTNNHVLTGTGYISGDDYEAMIEIGDDSDSNNLTLTSTTVIRGAMWITPNSTSTGTMTFVNNGVVEANNASDPLEICPDLLAGSGEWKVMSSANAELRLWTGSTSLTGDITVSQGTLDIDSNFETTGDLIFTGGQIEVAPNVRFVANK